MVTVKESNEAATDLTVGDANSKTFGSRLRLALGDRSIRSFAKACGSSPAAMRQYLIGENEPTRPVLNAIAKESGCSVQWLMTGEGPMRPERTASGEEQAKSTAIAFDEELMGRIVDGISRIYREESWRLAPVDQGRLTARILGKLMAAYDDPSERFVGLKLALEELRLELRKAPGGDGQSSKRSA